MLVCLCIMLVCSMSMCTVYSLFCMVYRHVCVVCLFVCVHVCMYMYVEGMLRCMVCVDLCYLCVVFGMCVYCYGMSLCVCACVSYDMNTAYTLKNLILFSYLEKQDSQELLVNILSRALVPGG